MSDKMHEKPSKTVDGNPHSGDDTSDALEAARAETDRLFAVAARSFEAMTQNDSHEFLRRSRQTGGQ